MACRPTCGLFPTLRLFPDNRQHRSYCWDEDQRVQIGISPRRIPRVTASVRVEAPSLSRIELMWNLTVCSEIPRRAAISLLTSPSPFWNCENRIEDSHGRRIRHMARWKQRLTRQASWDDWRRCSRQRAPLNHARALWVVSTERESRYP